MRNWAMNSWQILEKKIPSVQSIPLNSYNIFSHRYDRGRCGLVWLHGILFSTLSTPGVPATSLCDLDSYNCARRLTDLTGVKADVDGEMKRSSNLAIDTC
jgi:hypothetical protein